MKAQKLIFTLALGMISTISISQSVLLEGYTYAANNRGMITEVNIKVLDADTDKLEVAMTSGIDGAFAMTLPRNRKYRVIASRKNYIEKEEIVSTIGLKDAKKVFVKIEMEPSPGYIFDVTLAESRPNLETKVQALDSARIEVYNNTTNEEELVLLNHPSPIFKFIFEPGNHYTIMIRRKGFFNKRIQAYVDVEDCILCFDGLGDVQPNVLDLMSKGNSMGTFLANIDMEPIQIDKTYAIDNIYYGFDKSDITPEAANELDKLVTLLQDNQQVIVELGSHSDSRGNDEYNLRLSEKRAAAAVAYLTSKEGISEEQLVSKGYGEQQLFNQCDNGYNCTEAEHKRNRRTELKIIGTIEIDPLDKKTLKQIIEEGITDEQINSTE